MPGSRVSDTPRFCLRSSSFSQNSDLGQTKTGLISLHLPFSQNWSSFVVQYLPTVTVDAL